MKLTYHGHSAWEVHTGGAHIWIDPFLSQNPRADVEVKDVKHLTNIIAALRATPAINTVERARG